MFAVIETTELEALIRRTVADALQRDRVPPILTKAQVAEYLGKSIATINRYMREDMPFRKDGNGYPEFYKADIDRWIEWRSLNATAAKN